MTTAKKANGIWEEIFKPTLVLVLISVIIGVLLAFTYNAAGVEAVANAGLSAEELDLYMGDALPGSTKLTSVAGAEPSAAEVKGVYRDEGGAGYAVYVVVSGYKDDLKMLVGVTPDGAIAGSVAISSNETPGIGTKALEASYLDRFKGISGTITLGENVDALAGATYSSKGVAEAMNLALATYEETKGVLAGE